MFDPSRSQSVAEWFWNHSGKISRFPREPILAASKFLPISIVMASNLTIPDINRWLNERGLVHQISDHNRLLCGCLYARFGHGIVFLNSAQSSEELRFSATHELSHFLLHYYLRRIEAIKKLGEGIIDVLDGVRAPTQQEKISAALSRLTLGLHMHMMERDNQGHPDEHAGRYEVEADLLAFELLAPFTMARQYASNEQNLSHKLREHFGLPEWAAQAYSDLILSRMPPQKGVRHWFD